MNRTISRRAADIMLLMGIACAVSVFLCLLAYQVDNKYTSPEPWGHNGVLTLDEYHIQSGNPIFLISGWAYYSGKLLTPEDFTLRQPIPDQYIFISQYGGFEAGDYSASPHGSASYRLTINLPREPQTYMLWLPEIFSAYTAYVDGKQLISMGDTNPQAYRPQTGNRTVTFEAADRVDILIAVSDFSHFYSGMVHPPVFGTPEIVANRLYASFLFRSTLCACALIIGGIAILVGILWRRLLTSALYVLLCLLYIGYACYPLTQMLMGGSRITYAVENFSFCAMLLVIMLLIQQISGLRKIWSGLFLLFGAAISLASLLLLFELKSGNLSVMRAYSTLISLYEWVAAGYITYAVVRGALQNREYIEPILCGGVIFSTALIMDRVLPLYEPVVGGWFIELASFILILSVGAAIGQEVTAQYRDRAVLNERIASMEQVLFLQKKNYAALQKEMEKTKIMRHDMRHHFNIIGGFVENSRYDDLRAYLVLLGTNIAETRQEEYSANHIINILAHHYAFLSQQNGISFDFRCGVGGEIAMSDTELCSLLSNLLENAVESCLKIKTGQRFIRVALMQVGKMFSVHVENSCEDNLRPARNTFLSTKDRKLTGYGLASVTATARRHNGNTDFAWNSTAGIFVSRITLNL